MGGERSWYRGAHSLAVDLSAWPSSWPNQTATTTIDLALSSFTMILTSESQSNYSHSHSPLQRRTCVSHQPCNLACLMSLDRQPTLTCLILPRSHTIFSRQAFTPFCRSRCKQPESLTTVPSSSQVEVCRSRDHQDPLDLTQSEFQLAMFLSVKSLCRGL